MIKQFLRIVCDHCGLAEELEQGANLETADRLWKPDGWMTVVGDEGRKYHFCPADNGVGLTTRKVVEGR